MPRRIRCGPDQVTVEIGRTVVPPDRAAFSQEVLGLVDLLAGRLQAVGIACASRQADSPSCTHEQGDMTGPVFGRQTWIRSTPQAAPHDDVPAVRCLENWMGHGFGATQDDSA